MSYFNFLPNTIYGIRGTNDKIVVKNILARAKIMDAMKNFLSASAEYTIADEERPEHLAHRVYKRADYHWVILMFNEIHDPYFSWPLSTNELEKHMEKTYSGKALFINTGGFLEDGRDAIVNETIGLPHDRKLPHFEVGSTIFQYGDTGQKIASATITSWDPNLWKITIDNIDGVFKLQQNAATVDLSTGNLNPIGNPLALRRDLRCLNSKGQWISASLLRITDDNRYALHHFENEMEETVSPWYVPKNSASPLIERYVNGRQEVIETAEGTFSIVTNLAHEERVNDAKRNIKVMRPEYIDPLLKEMSRVMGV